MTNPFRRFFNKPEPPKEPERRPWTGYTVPAPGEITVIRNWTDNVKTDTTIFIVGGQVETKVKDDIKALISGEAHITHYGRKRKTPKLVGLAGSMGMI